MDDTVAIQERLGRIGALAEAGAARRELLPEVRGLLEEGERTLRAQPPGEVGRPTRTGEPAPPREVSAAGGDEPSSPRLGSGSGEEATVA